MAIPVLTGLPELCSTALVMFTGSCLIPILLIIGAVSPPHTTVVKITRDSVVDTYISRCSPGMFNDYIENKRQSRGQLSTEVYYVSVVESDLRMQSLIFKSLSNSLMECIREEERRRDR